MIVLILFGVLGRCKARRVVEYRTAFAGAETGQMAAATCISRWWRGFVCRDIDDDVLGAAEEARDMLLESEARIAVEADDYSCLGPPADRASIGATRPSLFCWMRS